MSLETNVLVVNFESNQTELTEPVAGLIQWDTGQKLFLTGLQDMPLMFACHFAHEGDATVTSVLMERSGQGYICNIPDKYLQTADPITFYTYYSGTDYTETRHSGILSVEARTKPDLYESTEEQSNAIDTAISKINEIIDQEEEVTKTATESAESAKTSATESANSALGASDSATTAESWAVGGTNTRDGEDTDNAKYYAQSVKTLAQTSEVSANRAQSWAVGGTGIREGEDTDNSKYYAEQAKNYSDNASAYTAGLAERQDEVEAKVTTLENNVPSQTIATINHNMHDYVHAECYHYTYGAGVGGAGEGPAGGTDLVEMPSETTCPDKLNCSVKVPEIGTVEALHQINDYTYVVTFTDLTDCVGIFLRSYTDDSSTQIGALQSEIETLRNAIISLGGNI